VDLSATRSLSTDAFASKTHDYLNKSVSDNILELVGLLNRCKEMAFLAYFRQKFTRIFNR
jgi:hypothetical protein